MIGNVVGVASPNGSAGVAESSVIEARNLTAGYGDLAAVRQLDLHVSRGEIVALLGPNGAGKTTTLLTLAGVLSPLGGAVLWHGAPARGGLHRRARNGLALVPEERSVLMNLSVLDNLRLGHGSVDTALAAFPELTPLLRRRAGVLSGGEQQMLTLARALASEPAALLIDELSLGLAPLIVDRLLAALREAATTIDVAVLLVEQQVRRALQVADRWYLLRQGRVAGSGKRSDTAAIERLYLSGDRHAPAGDRIGGNSVG